MNGSRPRSLPTLPESERYLAIGATAMLIPVIVAGNFLVIIAYKINRRLRTRTNTFLISLAVSDVVVGAVGLPMWVFCMVEYTECLASPNYSMIFKFLDRFGAFASIFHLTAISIERYIAVCKPYMFSRLHERYFFAASAFAWVLAMFLASLSWLGRPHITSYNMVVFITGFALPAIIVISMYVGIFRSAKAMLDRTPTLNLNSKANHIREDQKVAVTVAMISGLFIVAWLPFFSLSIIVSYCGMACLPKDILTILRMTTAVKWLHYSNSGVNPIIYAFRDREWKKSFKKILRIKDSIHRSKNHESEMTISTY